MSSKLKRSFILFYFILFYFIFIFDEMHLTNIILKQFLLLIIILDLLFLLFIAWELFNEKLLSPSISAKIIITTILFTSYFFIEQSIFKISMYSIGGSGGWIRNHIYEDIDYVFQWYEILFWNFIFSLHYPIYIFIFFKPFVNHLDKSIRKIKAERINDPSMRK